MKKRILTVVSSVMLSVACFAETSSNEDTLTVSVVDCDTGETILIDTNKA